LCGEVIHTPKAHVKLKAVGLYGYKIGVCGGVCVRGWGGVVVSECRWSWSQSVKQ